MKTYIFILGLATGVIFTSMLFVAIRQMNNPELTDTDEFIEIPDPPVFSETDSIVFQDAVWWFATLPDTFYTFPDGRRGAEWRDFDIHIRGNSRWMDSIFNDIVRRRASLFNDELVKYRRRGRGDALFMADGTRIETYYDSLGNEYKVYTRGYRTKVPE